MLKKHRRPDGRAFDEIRQITIETGVLPRTHGSALFTRGETQALVTVTLGTKEDEQRIELLEPGEASKRFMLHYNFPPFSVGEVGFMRGPGRREIGHGALAERALTAHDSRRRRSSPTPCAWSATSSNPTVPARMATVCGASLALMDAGVPMTAHVGGIAMGLVKEGDDYAILTDIAGAEDHYGDMDFKVAGTRDGITGLQMDIGCCTVGVATHDHDSTVPAGPTSTKSWASSSAVSGSHSSGGAITRSPLRMPMIRRSVSAVMKAPTTGPSDRLYGNWMVAWTTSVARVPPGTSRTELMRGDYVRRPPVCPAVALGRTFTLRARAHHRSGVG